MLDLGLGVRLLTPRTQRSTGSGPDAGTGQGVKVRI